MSGRREQIPQDSGVHVETGIYQKILHVGYFDNMLFLLSALISLCNSLTLYLHMSLKNHSIECP